MDRDERLSRRRERRANRTAEERLRDAELLRRWKAENKSHILQYQKQYYSESPDQRNKKSAAERIRRSQFNDDQKVQERERNRDNMRRWRASLTPAQREEYRIKWLNSHRRSHGLTRKDSLSLLESQGGRCACCGRQIDPNKSKSWATHHDHHTQQVYDILCGLCNTGLGCFEDNLTKLRLAVEYLESLTFRVAQVDMDLECG